MTPMRWLESSYSTTPRFTNWIVGFVGLASVAVELGWNETSPQCFAPTDAAATASKEVEDP